MARVKKNLGENVSGKVGNVVFFQLEGKTYVRGTQQRQNDSWTPAQLAHRKRISQVSRLWRKIKYSQMPAIWSLGDHHLNGFALFVKNNLPAYATDGSLVDVREIKLSTGNLLLPQEFTAQRKAPNEALITVSWQNKAKPKDDRLLDELMVICFTGDAYTDVMATSIRRKDLGGEFELPAINVPVTYVYLFFASSNRNEYTESACFEV